MKIWETSIPFHQPTCQVLVSTWAIPNNFRGCDHSPADHESLCFRIGNSSMQSHAPDSSTPSPKTRSRSPRPISTAPHILAHCSSTSRGGFRDRAIRE